METKSLNSLKITGTIVTYNNGKIIENCIKSILEHTKDLNFKLYIIDNASTDNTVEIIEEKFPDVAILKNTVNVGFGAAHNEVLSFIDSKYHLVINPDIEIDDNVIEKLAVFMEKNRNVSMVTPKVLYMDGKEQFLPKRQPKFSYVVLSKFPGLHGFRDEYTMKNRKMKKATAIKNITGCFFMIDTEVFMKLGGFDERFFLYFEDADLARRAEYYGRLVFYPKAHVYHGWKRDNVKSMKGIRIFLMSYLKYILKWLRG